MPCPRDDRQPITLLRATAGRKASLSMPLVVGAGPAGTSAMLRLMEAGLRVLLLEREAFGGTITHYPRAKVVMTGFLDFPMYGRVSKSER